MSQNFLELFTQIKDAGFDPLGMVFSSVTNVFQLDFETQKEIKAALIAANFHHHYENNTYYRSVCEEKGISSKDIHDYNSLIKIPLIPVKRFKESSSHILLSTTLDKIEFEMRSTGTSGIPSVSRRDSKTVSNAILSLYAMYREFFAISKGAILYLMPSTEEIPEMGMIKALNLFSGLTDAQRCPVKRTYFNPTEAVDALLHWENKHTRHIIGPPFMVYKLIEHLKANNLRLNLDKQSYVINLGGWKRFTGMEISRDEYNRNCAYYLGIKENQIRDMYGLVEANNLAIECEHQHKHVSPWVHFSVRDQNDLSKEVPYGQRGVLAILDPSSVTYPTFILTEDLVYLNDFTSCKCGRNGQSMVYLSRIKGAEIGCCAINLERQMDEAGSVKVKAESKCIIA
jgi:long-chain-fatty-acid---luciferin-component ligase